MHVTLPEPDAIAATLHDTILAGWDRPSGRLPAGVVVERDARFVRFVADPYGWEGEPPREYLERMGMSPSDMECHHWHWVLSWAGAWMRNHLDAVGREHREAQERLWRIPGQVDNQLTNDFLSRFGLREMLDILTGDVEVTFWHLAVGWAPGSVEERVALSMEAGGLPFGLEGERLDGDLLVYWPHAHVEPTVAGDAAGGGPVQPPKRIAEYPPTAEEQAQIDFMVDRGLELIGMSREGLVAAKAVAALDAKARSIQRLLPIARPGMLPPVEQLGNALGAVFGQMLVREYSWSWIRLSVAGRDYFVVASPGRAMICNPLGDLVDMLAQPGREPKILLNFNLFGDPRNLPQLKPRAYQLISLS